MHLDVILIFVLLMETFFSFQNILYFLRVHKIFSEYKVCFSSMWSNPQIVDIEYLQGICCPIFDVEEFSKLSAYPSIFLIKDLMSAQIIYGIISDFMYWLNSNISFSDAITILQKSLFLHTFSWDLGLFFVLNTIRTQFKK